MNIEFEYFKQSLIQELDAFSGLTVRASNAACVMADSLRSMSTDVEDRLASPTFDFDQTKGIKPEQPLNDYHQDVDRLSKPRQVLARFILQVSDLLQWYQRAAASDCKDAKTTECARFQQGHANAQIIGPQGLYKSNEIMVGVSVMGPNLRYPDHHHPPQEVYVVLSGGQWWQEGGQWHHPGLDGYVYNPENITHAMQSTDRPLLAIWCLDLTSSANS